MDTHPLMADVPPPAPRSATKITLRGLDVAVLEEIDRMVWDIRARQPWRKVSREELLRELLHRAVGDAEIRRALLAPPDATGAACRHRDGTLPSGTLSAEPPARTADAEDAEGWRSRRATSTGSTKRSRAGR
jgi:hypothetical protein